MLLRSLSLGVCALALSTVFVAGPTTSALALTMKECSVKYKAAQAAGTLKGMKWNDFRAKECAADDQDDPDEADAEQEPAAPLKSLVAPRGVTFPRAVSAKYANETAGKARMHTCVDAYKENKAKGTLNNLKWIQKGGGYYSLCNARLKGQ